jgi:glucose/arabinose dehydrogenase
VIPWAGSRGLPTTPIAAALLTTLLVGVTSAHAGTVSIAWDPSPDSSVIGYYVYVGTTSGVYTETYDVGNSTTFSYNAAEDSRHYFTVAAYAEGPRVGPRSSEVAAFGSSDAFWSSVWGTRSTSSGLHSLGSPNGRLTASATCWPPAAECASLTAEPTNLPVTIAAASADGRLFFAERGRRLRIVRRTGLARESVLIADRSTTLHHVALDPTFAESGWIWVSETQTSPDGRRTFAVVRYRVVKNRAGQRTEIVSGLTLPPSGNALFAIGESGHVYVAVPGSRQASQPYWGAVLRFNRDGSVPEDQAGSPVVGAGYVFPQAISLERLSERVWLSGTD